MAGRATPPQGCSTNLEAVSQRVHPFAKTNRLLITPIPNDFDAGDLLPAFNSNPGFLSASGYRPQFTRADVEGYLMEELLREDSLCLLIRLQHRARTIGTVAIQAPNPSDGLPWIGLLLIEALSQRQDFGTEAAQAIEDPLASEGWPSVRLFALRENLGVRGFWETIGYRVGSEAKDAHGREAWLLEKELSARAKVRGA